jgi:hypothetical protein
MGGRWAHRGDYQRHKKVRAAMLAAYRPGQPCARCRHPLHPTDKMDADHADDGDGYLGLSHSSPCRVCGRRCNQSAGALAAARRAGKQPSERVCVICGKPYTASLPKQVTCGGQPCITAIRAIRRAHRPDPPPPAQQGRVW